MNSLRPTAAALATPVASTSKRHAPSVATQAPLRIHSSTSVPPQSVAVSSNDVILPTFLQRRQAAPVKAPHETCEAPPSNVMMRDAIKEEDVRRLDRHRSGSEDDSSSDDSDTGVDAPIDGDDDDEDVPPEEKTANRVRIAEELSVATGMPLHEVLALLDEQEHLKAETRVAAREMRQAHAKTRVQVRRPPADDVSMTHAPALEGPPVARHGGLPQDTVAPPIAQRAVVVEGNEEEAETQASRMRRLLDELFPNGADKTQLAQADDGGASLSEHRRRRQAEQHAAVLAHLSKSRGVVETPSSLVNRDAFVAAYELELHKRKALKSLKEEHERRLREEAEQERKMRGIFVNLAIRKQIEAREASHPHDTRRVSGPTTSPRQTKRKPSARANS